MGRRRTALITLLLLAGLDAIPVVLTWRQVAVESCPGRRRQGCDSKSSAMFLHFGVVVVP